MNTRTLVFFLLIIGCGSDGATARETPMMPVMAPTGGAEPTVVRNDFRETVYANPSLVTDENGVAEVSFPLAHSITTWRATGDASTLDGRVGGGRASMRTFQSFFVDFTTPPRTSVGDTLSLPAIVYNYLDREARVDVSLDPGDFYEIQSASSQSVTLGPSEVRAVRFSLRLLRSGRHELTLRAAAGDVSDALTRTLRVDQVGRSDVQSESVVLRARATVSIEMPDAALDDGSTIEVSLAPGFASSASESLSSMMREPNGCFEQTTSTAWPNTLIAHYLDRAGELTPARRQQVIAMVTRGYQRLLTFESRSGGFNWWGNTDPGNRILSAIFLWHLEDLEGLIEIDHAVRDRTLAWLLAQQEADGSWDPGDALHAGNQGLSTNRARTTAFIAWALAHTGWAEANVDLAIGWLRSNPIDAGDLYANALSANARAMAEPESASTRDLLETLDRARVENAQGVSWTSGTGTWAGANGNAATIETTGLIAYAMFNGNAHLDHAQGAVDYILANKDAFGSWYATQTTMNALRALSMGGGTARGGELVVRIGDTPIASIVIDESNLDEPHAIDITSHITPGPNDIELEWIGTGAPTARVTRRAFLPATVAMDGPLSLTVGHDRTAARIGEPIQVTARATNNDADGTRDQVIVRVGRAPGLDPMLEDLDGLVTEGIASRYEVRDEDVTFYLMGLSAGETRTLRYRLMPGLAIHASAPASRIYPYYDASQVTVLEPVDFVIDE